MDVMDENPLSQPTLSVSALSKVDSRAPASSSFGSTPDLGFRAYGFRDLGFKGFGVLGF